MAPSLKRTHTNKLSFLKLLRIVLPHTQCFNEPSGEKHHTPSLGQTLQKLNHKRPLSISRYLSHAGHFRARTELAQQFTTHKLLIIFRLSLIKRALSEFTRVWSVGPVPGRRRIQSERVKYINACCVIGAVTARHCSDGACGGWRRAGEDSEVGGVTSDPCCRCLRCYAADIRDAISQR